jgi:DNA polymerase III delta prime subunit
MALTKEQIQELRDQLKEQIVHLPPEQKNQALQQIENLSPDALEAMLKQQEKSKPVFRSIIDKEIPSKIIEETPYALAVLDIKPISPGHVIIIPRSPTNSIKSMPSKCLVLANKISKRIVSRLKSKSFWPFKIRLANSHITCRISNSLLFEFFLRNSNTS